MPHVLDRFPLWSVPRSVRKVSFESTEMRVVFILLMIVWFVLKFVLHKGGYIHMFLVGAISVLVVELIAQRKTRYHGGSADH